MKTLNEVPITPEIAEQIKYIYEHDHEHDDLFGEDLHANLQNFIIDDDGIVTPR